MTVPLLCALLAGLAVLLAVPAGVGLPTRGAAVRARAFARTVSARLRDRGRAARQRVACVSVLEAFAAELRAGRPATTALERAAQDHQQLVPHALGALRLGGDVPDALVLDGQGEGRQVLRRLAACWRVGEGTGAGLAAAVSRVATAARESERVRLELAARTAEPRATMRVLAALPAFGLLLGSGLGADTVGWLFGTTPGRLVAAAGLGLDAAGLWWSRRLIRTVERAL